MKAIELIVRFLVYKNFNKGLSSGNRQSFVYIYYKATSSLRKLEDDKAGIYAKQIHEFALESDEFLAQNNMEA